MRTEQNKQVMLTPAAQACTCAHKGPLLLLRDTFLSHRKANFNARAKVCATLAENLARYGRLVHSLRCSAGAVGPGLNASPETQPSKLPIAHKDAT